VGLLASRPPIKGPAAAAVAAAGGLLNSRCKVTPTVLLLVPKLALVPTAPRELLPPLLPPLLLPPPLLLGVLMTPARSALLAASVLASVLLQMRSCSCLSDRSDRLLFRVVGVAGAAGAGEPSVEQQQVHRSTQAQLDVCNSAKLMKNIKASCHMYWAAGTG
jgi:hypothetical protein